LKVPQFLNPEYIEVDKKRQIRLISNVIQFLKDEEVGKPTENYVAKTYEIKYMDYNSGLYHALSPQEYIMRSNNLTKKSTDAVELQNIKTKLETIDSMLKKLKESYTNTERCIVIEYNEFDINPVDQILVLCPYIFSDDNMFRFKWSNTIAYNYHLINANEYSFSPSDESNNKLLLVWKRADNSEYKPTYVQIKKDTTKVTKLIGDDEILDVLTIKDQSQSNMCKIQVTNVDIPDEMINAGFKFES